MSESQLNSRDITFRTVFHDVEGIKSYLRRLRGENERILKNIYSLIQSEVYKVFTSMDELHEMIGEVIDAVVSPLQTQWVDNNFIDYISDSISASTINLISNNFMSIVDYNSSDLNAYINSALTSDKIEEFISPLQTQWISGYFISYIADKFTEIDIKNMLNEYHLIKKYHTTLESNVIINISGETDALKRFRILAYISGDNATDNLHYRYASSAITEDAYTVNGGDLLSTVLTIANLTTTPNDTLNVAFNTDTANVDYNSYLGGTLWYGFPDLIDPNM